MPWFQVDDRAAFHRKVVAAGNSAMGLWVRAGSWCAGEVNEGFVPDHMVATMGTATQARRLVKVGLWHRDDAREGYQFHQFTEDGRNPTREIVLSRRQQAADKKRKQREGNGQKSAKPQVDDVRPGGTDEEVPEGVPGGVNASSPLHSTPSSPNGEEPSLRSGGTRERATPSKKRGTRIPDDFSPTPEMVEWARQKTPLVGRYETEQFIDYWRGIPGAKGEKVDWVATWRRWMRETQARAEERGGTRPGAPVATGSRRMDKVLSALDPDDPFLSEYQQQQTRPAQDGLMMIEGGLSA